jgi:hypothetical protein
MYYLKQYQLQRFLRVVLDVNKYKELSDKSSNVLWILWTGERECFHHKFSY